MQAIVESHIPGAHIVAVISNRPDAAGLAWAKERDIPTSCIDHTTYSDRPAFERALRAEIDSYHPDLIVLAGFMRILGAPFVEHYQNRLLNIHPSLLPAFPGLHTHQRALDAGCRIAGCTVHLVTPELDHGPVVIQAAVPILPGDDEDMLAQRVLQAEHQIYPQAIKWFVDGRLTIQNQHIHILDESPAKQALIVPALT